jgi:sulfatase modifying factor 1
VKYPIFLVTSVVAATISAAASESVLPGSTFRDCEVCPELVVIPAGSVKIGAPYAEGGDDEWPVHDVVIPRLLAIGKYEVTKFEFAMFVEATAFSIGFSCQYLAEVGWEEGLSWHYPGFRQTHRDPVVCVNWTDAKAYVAWLSLKTGKTYRLPSESEWEYAARAGGAERYFFGNAISMLCEYGNGVDASSDFKWKNKTCKDGYGARTAPVGSFLPNNFGLYDTIGNVWEWIEDCWNDNYFGAPTDGTSWTTGDCSNRGTRGGSWLNDPRFLRSAHRDRLYSKYRKYNTGFRVVRDITAHDR